ncbi:MAG: GTP pyrophosphokinase [Bacteroidota bacterium]
MKHRYYPKKLSFFVDGNGSDKFYNTENMLIRSLEENEYLYLSAARGIATKLENLNDEFKYRRARNPIHQIITRIKTPRSIINKLRKRGYELSVKSARENISDIAGVRVICSYIDDIYLIADLLTAQDDIKIIRASDYIKAPKQNGYRSLHLVVTIPVFLSNENQHVKVEIQIRTIAMDFWASLEHELAYKVSDGKNEYISRELKACADIIATTDMRLQRLHNLTINSESKKR